MSCYHDTVEEYMEHHGHEKDNYGDGWLPKLNFKRHKRSRKFRRAQHIAGYVGSNGSGKSLLMVSDSLEEIAGSEWECHDKNHYHFKMFGQTKGYRKIFGTLKIIDPRTGGPHPLWIEYNDHKQMMFIEHAIVLFDEVQGVANVRENYSLPLQFVNRLSQLRKVDVVFRWTSPSWANAAAAIKTVTKAVTYCQGRFPIVEEGRVWGSPVHFVFKTFSSVDFDNFTIGTRERLLPEAWESYFRLFKHNKMAAPACYNTLDEVANIRSQTESGACLHCGGKKIAHRCSCGDEVDTEEHLFSLYQSIVEKEQSLTGSRKEDEGTRATLAARPSPPRKPVEFPSIPTITVGNKN